MAESGSILDSLWSWVTPREAEAKIGGGPDELAMLQAVERQNQQRQGQYLPDMEQRVITAAKAHPEMVTLQRQPGFLQQYGGTAGYGWKDRSIAYDPWVPIRDMSNPLAHELVHFLSDMMAPGFGQDAQHALIQRFLGTNFYQPAARLQGYQPGAVPPVEQDWWRSLLGGPPGQWPGR